MVHDYEESILRCALFVASSGCVLLPANGVMESSFTGYDRQFCKIFTADEPFDLNLIKSRRVEVQCTINDQFHPLWIRVLSESSIEIEKWHDENILPEKATGNDIVISKIESF